MRWRLAAPAPGAEALPHWCRTSQGQRAVLTLLRTVGPLAKVLQVRREKVDDALPRYEATLRRLCTIVYNRYAFLAEPAMAVHGGRDMPYRAYISFLHVRAIRRSVGAPGGRCVLM